MARKKDLAGTALEGLGFSGNSVRGSQSRETARPETVPESKKQIAKRKQIKPETKSKRFQVLMKPSLYEQMKNRANEVGISVNDFVNQAIEIMLDA